MIANAIDGESTDVRAECTSSELSALAVLGLDPFEIDLRDHFANGTDEIVAELRRCDALWLRGGNVFVLRHALAASGADTVIVDLVRHDCLVYAGYSAGPCVLAPTLDGLEAVDDPAVVRRVYDADPTPSGLGLVSFRLVPHVDSPTHPESAALDAVADRYRSVGVEHVRLRDGEALLIEGERQAIVGSAATVDELLY